MKKTTNYITKLPDNLDPNRMIEQEIEKRYKKCPCCGETREFPSSDISSHWVGELFRSWYGKQYEYTPGKIEANWSFFTPPKYWFEKDHYWRINSYFCTGCGAKWESPAFRYDILTQEEAQEIYNKLFNEE